MTYRGNGQFTCDKCPEDIEVDGDGFKEQFEAAKENGWRAYKDGKLWMHACPSCVEDFTKGDEG